MMDTTSITAVLLWIIAGPGAAYLVGQLMAFLLENFPAWHTFPTWVKFSVPMAFGGVLFSVLAKILIGFPGRSGANLALVHAHCHSHFVLRASQRQYMKTRETGYGANPAYK